MNISKALAVINQMQRDGVIEKYAVGGAVGASFYNEPVSTLDVDIFVVLDALPGSLLISPYKIYDYLKARGYAAKGEYILIEGWPVQFLPALNALVSDALDAAVQKDAGGTPVSVFTAEHLAAIALQTGRAKDKSRLLQFIEGGALDMPVFKSILKKHGLTPAWLKFKTQFLQ